MTSRELSEYNKMTDEEESPKIKFTRGDLIVPNKDNEVFLCFFTPKVIDVQCLWGFDLNSGMKFVACFIFYVMAFHFFRIISDNSYRTYFIGTTLCSCYIITLFNIFQSLEELSYEKSVFNYRFFMIVYFLEIFTLVFETIYLILFDRLYFSSYTLFGLIFSYGCIILTILIETYMVWITFCFMEHVKNNRLYLLQDINNNNLFSISP